MPEQNLTGQVRPFYDFISSPGFRVGVAMVSLLVMTGAIVFSVRTNAQINSIGGGKPECFEKVRNWRGFLERDCNKVECPRICDLYSTLTTQWFIAVLGALLCAVVALIAGAAFFTKNNSRERIAGASV